MENRDPAIVRAIAKDVQYELNRAGDGWELTLGRHFNHAPERLWTMITDPAQLAKWSPIVPDRPLTSAGPAVSRENPDDDPVAADVIEADPPRLLVHRWGSDELRWLISPDGAGSLLELRQRFVSREMAGSYGAGWRICLGTLAVQDDGDMHERVVGQRAMAYDWVMYRERFDGDCPIDQR